MIYEIKIFLFFSTYRKDKKENKQYFFFFLQLGQSKRTG